MPKRSKQRVCRRCARTIQPNMESHASFTLKIRECSGVGTWLETGYAAMHLCASCWEVVDAVIAGVATVTPIEAAPTDPQPPANPSLRGEKS